MQRLGIRRKTLIALLGVAVPALIAFSALIILSTAHILQRNAGRQVSTLASRSAQGLAELVDHSQATLRTMAASPELDAFRTAALGDKQLQMQTALKRMEQSFLG